VASYLLNNKRSELSELEKRYQVEITIVAEVDMKPADNEISFHKAEKEIISKKQA
jgi:Ribonuclease G/E